jgi:hypothetical protein
MFLNINNIFFGIKMATNPYFNNYKNNENEQNLLHALSTELIEQRGVDLKYIPREFADIDHIFGDVTESSFKEHYIIDMLIENAEEFEGDGELLSKFGIELKNKLTLSVNPRKFTELTGYKLEYPRMGDLIFFPLNNSLFEITFVQDSKIKMLAAGTLPYLKIECELFKYGNEEMDTGIEEIDDMDEVFKPEVNIENIPTGSTEWGKNIVYEIGDKVFPTEDNWTGLYYQVYASRAMKTTGVKEPVWPKYNGGKVVDHEITWIAKGVRNEKDQIKKESVQILDFSNNDPFKFR